MSDPYTDEAGTEWPFASIQEGDFLTASWGYDQINASFWHVMKRTEKMVTLEHVESQRYEDTDRLAPTSRPVIKHDWKACEVDYTEYDRTPEDEHRAMACYKSEVIRRKIQTGEHDEWVRVQSFMIARLYVGGGMFDTTAAGLPGH